MIEQDVQCREEEILIKKKQQKIQEPKDEIQQQGLQLEYHEEIHNLENQQSIGLQNDQVQFSVPVINVHQVHSEEDIQVEEQVKKQKNQFDQKIAINNQQNQSNFTIYKQKNNQKQNSQIQQKQHYEQEDIENIQQIDHGFKINICHIESKESLPQNTQYANDTCIHQQNTEQNHPNPGIFNQQNKQIKPIQNLVQNKLPKKQQRFSQQKSQKDDYYVQLLENKWAERQKAQKNCQRQSNQQPEKNYQSKEIRKNDESKQICKQQKQTVRNKYQTNNLFKIKKKPDQRMARTGQKFRSSKKSQLPEQNISLTINKQKSPNQNHSQLVSRAPIKLSQKQLKVNKRTLKKHYSNVQSVSRSLSRSRANRVQQQNIKKDIKYEFAIGGEVQMMSKLLEDWYYNNRPINHYSSGSVKKPNFDMKQPLKKQLRQSQATNIQQTDMKKNISENNLNKIRKIIKRSPYGLLQIQVKEKKNNSKITNLRILKPKQMIKLKKVSRMNKENQSAFLDVKRESNFGQFNLDGQLPRI